MTRDSAGAPGLFFQRGGEFLTLMELVLLFPPLHFAGALRPPWVVVTGAAVGLYLAALAFDTKAPAFARAATRSTRQ